jgi:farnesyl-diphosphate farnesyltransferase
MSLNKCAQEIKILSHEIQKRMESLLTKFDQIFQETSLPLQIHTESVTSFFAHPDEAFLALAFRFGLYTQTKLPLDTPEYAFCERILKQVSRSFSLVIQTLPPDLRISVCVFYLVLRALDTIEDDMITFQGKKAVKQDLLRGFADNLSNPAWTHHGIGDGDEKTLLEEFSKVLHVYHTLPKHDQEIISQCTREMGNGMAEFLGKEIRTPDYNLYCHIVAGVVGEGLTKLFVANGVEDKALLGLMKEADEMGLFLQKTNIVRDYLEDLNEGRSFWPRDVWEKYAPSLLELRRGDKHKSLECLNELVLDAYRHVPAVIRYLEAIKDPKVFKFCAIPQVMAIATLERLVNNPDVFTGIVKIRKGLMLSLFQYTSGIEEVKGILSTYSDALLSNLSPQQPIYKEANLLVAQVQALCSDGIQPSKPWPSFLSLFFSLSILMYAFLQKGGRQWIDLLLFITMSVFFVIKKLNWFSQHMFAKGSS